VSLFDSLVDDEEKAPPKKVKKVQESPRKPAKEEEDETESAGEEELLENGDVKMREPAPWAVENCPSCGGCGLNSKAGACRICLQRKTKDQPGEEGFEIVSEDGIYSVVPRAPREQEEKKAKRGRPPKAKEEEDPPEPEPLVLADTEKKRGRPLGRPILLINCTLEYDDEITDLHQLFTEVKAQLVAHEGVDNFYSVDVWKRRELIAMVGEKLAGEYRNKFIRCTTTDAEKLALVEALRPHSRVIQGVR